MLYTYENLLLSCKQIGPHVTLNAKWLFQSAQEIFTQANDLKQK